MVSRKIMMFSVAFAFIVICATLALLSCEKVNVPDGDGAVVVKGNLRVSVCEIEKTPFASLTRGMEPVANVCTRLNFAVYDMGGSRLKLVNQEKGNANFGVAGFQLEEGDYQLVVVGHSANGNPTMTNPEKIQFTNVTGYTDTFLCYGEVNIGEEQVDYEVSLDRVVALCRFIITDDIPAEVKKLQFYYTGGSGAFDATTGLGCVGSKQTVTFDVAAVGEKQFDLYTFLHDLSGNIALTVTALDASGNELCCRQFDVPMQQNHITWLSGAFFNGIGSPSTTITGVTVNTDWAGETHLRF